MNCYYWKGITCFGKESHWCDLMWQVRSLHPSLFTEKVSEKYTHPFLPPIAFDRMECFCKIYLDSDSHSRLWDWCTSVKGGDVHAITTYIFCRNYNVSACDKSKSIYWQSWRRPVSQTTHRCQGHETSHLYQRDNSYHLRHLWPRVLWSLDFDIVLLVHAEMVYMDFSAAELFYTGTLQKAFIFTTFFFQITALDDKPSWLRWTEIELLQWHLLNIKIGVTRSLFIFHLQEKSNIWCFVFCPHQYKVVLG